MGNAHRLPFVEELHKDSIASNLPALSQMRLTDHHGMKEMPDVCISIYMKEFQNVGIQPAEELPQILRESCLAAIQTTFLQNRAITLCKKRIDSDPQERED